MANMLDALQFARDPRLPGAPSMFTAQPGGITMPAPQRVAPTMLRAIIPIPPERPTPPPPPDPSLLPFGAHINDMLPDAGTQPDPSLLPFGAHINDMLPDAGTQRQGYLSPVTGARIRNDSMGLGGFGTPRRSDETGKAFSHKGIDIVSQPGEPVVAPIGGTVARLGKAHPGDNRFDVVQINGDDGMLHTLIYLSPTVKPGDRIDAGGRIGTSQDVSKRYGPKMTPHVYWRVQTAKGDYVDPTPFLQGGTMQGGPGGDTLGEYLGRRSAADLGPGYQVADLNGTTPPPSRDSQAGQLAGQLMGGGPGRAPSGPPDLSMYGEPAAIPGALPAPQPAPVPQTIAPPPGAGAADTPAAPAATMAEALPPPPQEGAPPTMMSALGGSTGLQGYLEKSAADRRRQAFANAMFGISQGLLQREPIGGVARGLASQPPVGGTDPLDEMLRLSPLYAEERAASKDRRAEAADTRLQTYLQTATQDMDPSSRAAILANPEAGLKVFLEHQWPDKAKNIRTVDGKLVYTDPTTMKSEVLGDFSKPEKPTESKFTKVKFADGHVEEYPNPSPQLDAAMSAPGSETVSKAGVEVNIDQSKGPESLRKALGSQFAPKMDAIVEAAGNSQTSLQNLDSLEGAMQNFSTGKLSEAKLALGQWANALGLADTLGIDIQGISSGEQFKATVNNLVRTAVKDMKGALSDRDLAFLQSSMPSLLTTPEGNKVITALMRVGFMNQQALAEKVTQYVAANPDLDPGAAYQELVKFQKNDSMPLRGKGKNPTTGETVFLSQFLIEVFKANPTATADDALALWQSKYGGQP